MYYNIINQLLFNSRQLKYRLLYPEHDKSIWFHVELCKCINNKYKKVLKIIADNENCDENFSTITNNENYRNFLLNNVEVIKTNNLYDINFREYDAIGIYDAEQYHNLHYFISDCIKANIYVFFTATQHLDDKSHKNIEDNLKKIRSCYCKRDYGFISTKLNQYSLKHENQSKRTFDCLTEITGITYEYIILFISLFLFVHLFYIICTDEHIKLFRSIVDSI